MQTMQYVCDRCYRVAIEDDATGWGTEGAEDLCPECSPNRTMGSPDV